MKKVLSVAALLVSLSLSAYLLMRPVHGQNVSFPATIPAGVGAPPAGWCTGGAASASTSSLWNDNNPSNTAANTIYKCNYNAGVYSVVAPYTVGNQTFYGSSGLLVGGKCWLGQVTSNTSGQATVNWSSAGFSSAPFVQLQPVSAGTAAGNAVWANPSSVTSTGANITVTTPVTLVTLGLTVQLASVAYAINVQACGS